MLKVFKRKYTVTPKENAYRSRTWPALVKTGDMVLTIAGNDLDGSFLSTVSAYSIDRDVWTVNLPQLNHARSAAGACVLKATVYVFGGYSKGCYLNIIESILETSIVS